MKHEPFNEITPPSTAEPPTEAKVMEPFGITTSATPEAESDVTNGESAAKGDGRNLGEVAAESTVSVLRDAVTFEAENQRNNGALRDLAALPLLEYDQVREKEAEKLGVRVSTLDKLVVAERKGAIKDGRMDFIDVPPYPHPVEPADVLNSIVETIKRFIVCDEMVVTAVALWIAMTWFIDVVLVSPLAVITAPEKRCGKSQLLSLMGRLVYRPLLASNISPAALFRAIDAWKPTLLIDEADSFMRENEELRGVLNCGHSRDCAYVIRVEGDPLTPTRFSVWGAKAIAGIGKLADTVMDRAVTLPLRRKLPHESVERLRHGAPEVFEILSAKLARFALDYMEQVRRARPLLPETLNDRAQDNWEPLLAIADVAGDDWPQRARDAAVALSKDTRSDLGLSVELLSDVSEVFLNKGLERITSAALIVALCEDDEKPWATFNKGRRILPRQVSSILQGYGISSQTIRIGASTAKGYYLHQFEESFRRYLIAPMENSP